MIAVKLDNAISAHARSKAIRRRVSSIEADLFLGSCDQALAILSLCPSLPFSHKRPISALRPMTPKWTSLDLLRVMARVICGTSSPLTLAVYFLCSPTWAFNHEITIPSCRSSTLDGSRAPRRDVGGTGPISKGWLASTKTINLRRPNSWHQPKL